MDSKKKLIAVGVAVVVAIGAFAFNMGDKDAALDGVKTSISDVAGDLGAAASDVATAAGDMAADAADTVSDAASDAADTVGEGCSRRRRSLNGRCCR